MLSLKKVVKYYDSYICRRCLNYEYGADLIPDDCRYGMPGICPCCQQQRNIVVGLSPWGRRKMLLKA